MARQEPNNENPGRKFDLPLIDGRALKKFRFEFYKDYWQQS